MGHYLDMHGRGPELCGVGCPSDSAFSGVQRLFCTTPSLSLSPVMRVNMAAWLLCLYMIRDRFSETMIRP